MMLHNILLFGFFLVLQFSAVDCVEVDVELMHSSMLREGRNLIYVMVGNSQSLPRGVEDLLTRFEMYGIRPKCVDSLTTSAREAVDIIGGFSGENPGTTVVAFENVEKLRTSEQLMNLDFLFRLSEKSFDLEGILVLLLFDTDTYSSDGTSSANEGVKPFWDAPNWQLNWREALSSMWAADEAVQFNADAAVGRIHHAVNLSSPAAQKLITTVEVISQGTSVCSALHALRASPPPLLPALPRIDALLGELGELAALRSLGLRWGGREGEAGALAQEQERGLGSSLNVREALTVVIVSNLVFYVSILCR